MMSLGKETVHFQTYTKAMTFLQNNWRSFFKKKNVNTFNFLSTRTQTESLTKDFVKYGLVNDALNNQAWNVT